MKSVSTNDFEIQGNGRRINRGQILVFPTALMLPAAMFAPKGLALLFILTVIAVISWGIFYKQHLLRISVSPLLPFIGLNIFAILSSSWSPTPFVSLKSSLILSVITLGGLLIVSFAKSFEASEKKIVGYGLVFGAALTVLLLGVEIMSQISVWRWLRSVVTGVSDIPVTSKQMFVYNQAMSVVVLFIWPLFLFSYSKKRIFVLVGVLLAIIVGIWGEAETPTIALFLGVLTALFFCQRQAVMRRVLGSVILIMMAVSPFIPGLFPGPETIRAELPFLSHSAIQRIAIWKVSVSHIVKDPVLGLGMDTTRSLYGKETKFMASFPPPKPGGASWTANFEPIPLHPHNAILQIWLELGGIGIVGLAWIIITLIRAAGRYPGQPFIMSFGVSALVISSLSFGAWQNWWVCTLWLSAALLVSQIPITKSKNSAA